MESGKATDPLEPSVQGELAVSGDPMEDAEPTETLGGGERIDAAEEGRRARLRQVQPCHLFAFAWKVAKPFKVLSSSL